MQTTRCNFFGTDGIRKKMGEDPFTPESLVRLGRAIGMWAQKKYGQFPMIAMANDTRISSSLVKASLLSGLLQQSVTVYDAMILPTPALYKIMQERTIFHCGIMITASHNFYHDNGIKLFDRITGKLLEKDEEDISELFHAQATSRAKAVFYAGTEVQQCEDRSSNHINENSLKVNYDTLGTLRYWHDAQELYSAIVMRYFEKNFLDGITVVLDCAHGATYEIAADIFKKLGAIVHCIGDRPDGLNINKECGSLHTEKLQEAVQKYCADIGFAFDGDGDRITALNKHGEVKDGDDILAMLLLHPLYKNTKKIVGTIMTNHGLVQFLDTYHCSLIRTSVGDKFISSTLMQENLLLGGEQSGHIIMQDYLMVSDGIFTALRIIETIRSTGNWEMHSFKHYPQLILNVPVMHKKNLSDPSMQKIINEGLDQLESGRIIVRYSGTENILRIMIEDRTLEQAQKIGAALSQTLQKELSG